MREPGGRTDYGTKAETGAIVIYPWIGTGAFVARAMPGDAGNGPKPGYASLNSRPVFFGTGAFFNRT